MLFIALAALFVGLAVFLVAEVATLSARERQAPSAGPSHAAGRRPPPPVPTTAPSRERSFRSRRGSPVPLFASHPGRLWKR